jgi:hypothetical protein
MEFSFSYPFQKLVVVNLFKKVEAFVWAEGQLSPSQDAATGLISNHEFSPHYTTAPP